MALPAMSGTATLPFFNNSTATSEIMQHILKTDLDPASHIIHGHICATFGADQARLFWDCVIGVPTVQLQPVANGNGEPRIMLPAGPQSPAPPYAVAGVPGTWIVDYVPRFHLGPVVPQLPYVPTGTPDQIAQHYRRLRAPIWFINNNGSIGISLVNALSGQTSSLLGDRNPVGGTRQNTYFSLNWPEYPEYPKLINLYDSRREDDVKLGQLARKVANFVKDFIQEAAQQPGNHLWSVQNTGQFRSRILIVGLAQVTAGHYQPILQLCHGDASHAQIA